MNYKLEGICRFCVHATVTTSGERCSKAFYINHSGGYGDSWASNECVHDKNNRPKKDLFEPNKDKLNSNLELKQELINTRLEILKLDEENRKLRTLIK